MENKGSYIRGLDGLRAFAATIVFTYHLWGHWNYRAVILGVDGLQFDLTWIFHFAVAQPVLAGVSTEIGPRLALFYGLLVTAVALGDQVPGITTLLEWGPIRWLGMVSYSFYLYHDFALHLAFHRLPDLSIGSLVPDGVVKGVVAFAATLVVSAASYYLIESRFHGSAKRKTEILPAAAVEQAENEAAAANTRLARQEERASVRIDPH